MEKLSSIDEIGRILISPEILEKSGIKIGDSVNLIVEDSSIILIHPSALNGVIDHLKKIIPLIQELDACMEAVECFFESANSDDRNILDRFPVFFINVKDCFLKTIIVELCILLDKKEKSAQGIHKLLNKINNLIETEIIQNKPEEDLSEKIKSQKEEIASMGKTFDRILILRDKFISHWDKIKFNGTLEDKFSFEIPLEDIRKLLDISKSIVSFWHSELLNSSISMRFTNADDFSGLVKRMKLLERLHKESLDMSDSL